MDSKTRVNEFLKKYIKTEWAKGKVTGTKFDPPVFNYYNKSGVESVMQVNLGMLKITRQYSGGNTFLPKLIERLVKDDVFACLDHSHLEENGEPRVIVIKKKSCM